MTGAPSRKEALSEMSGWEVGKRNGCSVRADCTDRNRQAYEERDGGRKRRKRKAKAIGLSWVEFHVFLATLEDAEPGQDIVMP